jgi:uncharacterized membrane protein YdjX (TVP38/TMEM64 family)
LSTEQTPVKKKKFPFVKIFVAMVIVGLIVGLQFTPAKKYLSFEYLKGLPVTLTEQELKLEIIPEFTYSEANLPTPIPVSVFEMEILQLLDTDSDIEAIKAVYKAGDTELTLKTFTTKQKREDAAALLNSINFRDELVKDYSSYITSLYSLDGDKYRLITRQADIGENPDLLPLPKYIESSIFDTYIRSRLDKKRDTVIIGNLNRLYKQDNDSGLYTLVDKETYGSGYDEVKSALLDYGFYDYHQRNALDFTNYNYLKQFDDFKSDWYILFVLIFIVIYIIVVAMQLPGASFLTLGGGFLFGPLIGALYVNVGATLGATAAFFVARYILGSTLQEKFSKQLAKFNAEMDKNSALYLLTMRLIPAFPFFLINLLAGLTKIRARTFIWTTSLGIFPGSLVYAFAGSQLNRVKTLGDIMSPQVLMAFGFLILFSLIPIIVKKIVAKRKAGNAQA